MLWIQNNNFVDHSVSLHLISSMADLYPLCVSVICKIFQDPGVHVAEAVKQYRPEITICNGSRRSSINLQIAAVLPPGRMSASHQRGQKNIETPDRQINHCPDPQVCCPSESGHQYKPSESVQSQRQTLSRTTIQSMHPI